MADTNEVDTQTADDLSKETELEFEDKEIDDQEPKDDPADESQQDDDASKSDKDDINPALDLSDEEFSKYLETGKFPERKETPKKDKEEDGNEPKHSDGKSEESRKRGDSDSENERRRSDRQDQTKKGSDSVADKEKSNREDEHSAVDYKATYEQIFKPFKANGKDITPRTVEDVISLMQMGANYTKKMQTMAPMRKTFESLSKAEINDEELNFLIDVHKGDKEAIKKLLEKHKVDPLELDMDNTNYVPKNNLISNEDVEYSEVLDDVKPSLPKIQEILSTQWDKKSKEMLLADPKLLVALHEEIQYGRFDKVQSRLEIEKTFGRFKGKSDVEAYVELVTQMEKENQSSNTNKQNTNTDKPTNTPKRDVPDKSKVAPNKTAKSAPASVQFTKADIFSMSEEELAKLSVRNLV